MKTRQRNKKGNKKTKKQKLRLPPKFKNYGDGIVYMIFDGYKHVFKYVAYHKL